MKRIATPLLALTLALGTAACNDEPTGPDDDYDPEDYAQYDHLVVDPGYDLDLPPLEPRKTFWDCAGPVEVIYGDAATTAFRLEIKAFSTSNGVLQQQLLQQAANIRSQATAALRFGIQQCVNQYGPPPIWFVQDANGTWRRRQFTVDAYVAYVIGRYL